MPSHASHDREEDGSMVLKPDLHLHTREGEGFIARPNNLSEQDKRRRQNITRIWRKRIRLGNQHGFTLIELMIVVAIIGILAAIGIPLYANLRVQAADSVAKSDLRNAMTALQLYFVENETYLATSSELLASGFTLSKGVSFTKYDVSTMDDGGQTIHMHVKHVASPNAWHANYPKEGSEIQIR